MTQNRRSSSTLGLGFDRNSKVTVLTAAAATAAAAMSAAPATAAPALPHDPADTAKSRVDRLFEEAEQATEAYNAAEERTDKLRTEARRAQEAVAKGQDRINTMRGLLGAFAGAQYRSGGIDPALALMLSERPDEFLDKAAALGRLTDRQTRHLAELRAQQRDLDRERTSAGRKLAELEKMRGEVARTKREVTAKLADARRVLESMSTGERADWERGSRSEDRDPAATGAAAGRGGRGAGEEEGEGGGAGGWQGSEGPGGNVAASGRAAAAVRAAQAAIGRPYVWGATGPSGFDCSGLMVWSYRQAGVSLPRTSQAQRHAGRRVSLSEARPGDLVTYRSDASHVAMYVGNGQVVHAPYPGARVRYDPVGMMPISAVTRP
ncbi:NlpC/P60 family protein [Streptomyces sp. BI20]|uniref:C40 family peptidase n=1 Tax=Streptomyces sp. BI20 TaxID=3403460 RepID=UPI003C73EACC